MLTLGERLKDKGELYRRMMASEFNGLRVTSPGIIESFDPKKQTATIQLTIKERVLLNGNQTWEEIPLLLDVPVVLPRAGGYVLTMPIKKGDECLVIFADCCIDAWWQSGGVQNQVDKRRHDLSDGFAIIGTWSQPNVIPNYSTTSAQLRNDQGTAYIEISGDEINIKGTLNINNVPYTSHTHGGIQSGTGNTLGVSL